MIEKIQLQQFILEKKKFRLKSHTPSPDSNTFNCRAITYIDRDLTSASVQVYLYCLPAIVVLWVPLNRCAPSP